MLAKEYRGITMILGYFALIQQLTKILDQLRLKIYGTH